MDYRELVQAIKHETDLEDRERAEETAFVVLDALGERIGGGEAHDLFSQLPDPLRTRLDARVELQRPARSVPAARFVEEVVARLGVDREEAKRRVRAVLEVVRRAVSPGELEDVLAQLDSSYSELVPAG